MKKFFKKISWKWYWSIIVMNKQTKWKGFLLWTRSKSRKNPEWKIPKIQNSPEYFFYSQLKRRLFIIERTIWCQKFGLKLLKFSTEIWNTIKKLWVFMVFWPSRFFEYRDFHPQDFLKIPGIYEKSPGSGFFVEWDIPTKSQVWPLFAMENFENFGCY